MYFPDEPANDTDFALHKVDPVRVHSLIAKRFAENRNLFEWNVMLQGPGETVFFDC
jgi:hypothetical protein